MENAWAVIVSAAVGSLITLIGIIANNRHNLRVQREQWDREDARKREELAARKEQNEQLRKEKERIMLIDLYKSAISDLSNVRFVVENKTQYENGYPIVLKAQESISLILVNHYDISGDDFQKLYEEFDSFSGTYEDAGSYAEDLLVVLVQTMNNDPRLKI